MSDGSVYRSYWIGGDPTRDQEPMVIGPLEDSFGNFTPIGWTRGGVQVSIRADGSAELYADHEFHYFNDEEENGPEEVD